MNKITLIGNLTRDPETTVANGATVCKFTIAVRRRFAKETTDFFNINAWRQLADICSKYLEKGRKVAVVGELQARTYTGKDGQVKMSLDVSADEVEFLSPNTEQKEEPKPKRNQLSEDDFRTDIETADIPF